MFFHAEKRVIFARIAFICVYGHIMRVNMHIYAKYIIKKFCQMLDAHAYARYNKYILD